MLSHQMWRYRCWVQFESTFVRGITRLAQCVQFSAAVGGVR